MVNFVIGYMFNKEKSHVLLMTKNRPPSQFGLLNGLGGKVENNETIIECMCREFKEECGIETEPCEWELFYEYETYSEKFDDKCMIYCFRTFSNKIKFAETTTDEVVDIYEVSIIDAYRLVEHGREILEMCI